VILPVEISGYSRGLLQGFMGLGFEARFYEIAPEWVGRQRSEQQKTWDDNHNVEQIFQTGPGWRARISWYAQRIRVTRTIGASPKVVVCQFNLSLLPFALDLIYFKLKGSKILSLSGYGSESRAPHMNHPTISSLSVLGRLSLSVSAARKSLSLSWRYYLSDWFFCSPATGHLVKGVFFNWLDIGHPLDDSEFTYKSIKDGSPNFAFPKNPDSQSNRRAFRLLHAPSSMSTKGTPYIRAAVKALQLRHNVEYTEISGVTKAKLAAEMTKHDLLIDQVFSDYPLPVISSEAMARGLPALVSGYFAGAPLGYSQFNPPVLNCLPEELEATLEDLLTWNTRQWNEVKESAYEFVSQNFRPQESAKRLLGAILEQDQTSISVLSRRNIVYFDGLGAPSEIIQSLRLSKLARCFPGARWLSPQGR
jgi:hypothetical protein